MADTIESFELSQGWQSANALSGIDAGTALVIQNQGGTAIYCAFSQTEPNADFKGVMIPAKIDRPLHVTAGENEVWLRPVWLPGRAVVNIQQDD